VHVPAGGSGFSVSAQGDHAAANDDVDMPARVEGTRVVSIACART
jgi:hypothetical protein